MLAVFALEIEQKRTAGGHIDEGPGGTTVAMKEEGVSDGDISRRVVGLSDLGLCGRQLACTRNTCPAHNHECW